HLTDGELLAVMTFFEQQLREVGTERESNYLPIFALLLAAMMVLLMEPGLYANLFVREEHEYVDGPSQEEHHDDHGHESDTHSHNDQPPTDVPYAAQESKDTGSDPKQD